MNFAFEASQAHPYRTETGLDHKAWAKQILYRSEKKDSDLTSIQIRFASEALGIRTESK